MCTLYKLTRTVDEVRRLFGGLGDFAGDRANWPPFEGIYPGYEAPILRPAETGLSLDLVKWGVPPPPGLGNRPVVNVRNLQSPFWRPMLAEPARRCLVPLDAFWEYEGEKGAKRKVWFAVPGSDGEPAPFAFAGLWRSTEAGDRFAFLTCAPNRIVGAVHPKAMPVILDPADFPQWLQGKRDEAAALARPFADERMTILPDAPPAQASLL